MKCVGKMHTAQGESALSTTSLCKHATTNGKGWQHARAQAFVSSFHRPGLLEFTGKWLRQQGERKSQNGPSDEGGGEGK